VSLSERLHNQHLTKHGGNAKQLAQELGIEVRDIIDFSSNINPYGPPASVIKAARQALANINEYPEQDGESLAESIAGKLDIPPDSVVVGNGAIELISLVPQVFKPARAFLIVPSFTEYEIALLKTGIEIEYCSAFSRESVYRTLRNVVLRNGFYHTEANMVLLGNPNNPCGYRLSKNELLAFIDATPHTMWVIDEAFIEFTKDADKNSLIVEAQERCNIVIIRSLTKTFSIPGLRLGYLVSSLENAGRIKEAKFPWSVNTVALAAGRAAIGDEAFVAESTAKLSHEAQRVFNELSQIEDLTPFMPEANFIFVRIENGGVTSQVLQRQLLRKGLAVRDCSTFTGLDERYFRIAVKLPEENDKLIAALREYYLGTVR
jgi:threonine-phosphate decarboxylase